MSAYRTHYLLNLTWRCQQACPYCWVRQTVRRRPELVHAAERGLDDWARAIRRDTPDVVDVAGGEPLLLEWLPDLLAACPATRFGLSTNGRCVAAIERLALYRLPNVVSINLSYHPRAAADPAYEADYQASARALRAAGYPVHANVVAYGDNAARAQAMGAWLNAVGIPLIVSPYEETADLGEPMAQGLVCRGGLDHLTVAPDGAAWPCLTALRSPYWRETCLGNWLDGTHDAAARVQPCHLRCVDYYLLSKEHSAGDMWGVKARPADG